MGGRDYGLLKGVNGAILASLYGGRCRGKPEDQLPFRPPYSEDEG